jgi:hypothetical protein
MGGNALSVKPATRMSPQAYKIICKYLQFWLEDAGYFFSQDEMRIVPSYKNKDSHGDIDILVDVDDKIWQALINGGFEASLSNGFFRVTEMHKNGPVVSLGLQIGTGTVQIDFIKVKPGTMHNAFVYYGYNDLGNLMGRVAAGMGFKYGPDGLSYRLYAPDDENRFLGEILVTNDLGFIFEFLGYDYYVWADNHSEGKFKELTDVFEFASATKYFEREYFVLEKRNSADRRRDSKRSTYTKFLEWVEYEFFPLFEPHVNKDVHLNRAFMQFPTFRKNLLERINKYDEEAKLRKKFNAHVVMRNVPVTGPALGKFMAYLKNKDVKWDKVAYPETIDWLIQRYYEKFTKLHDQNV